MQKTPDLPADLGCLLSSLTSCSPVSSKKRALFVLVDIGIVSVEKGHKFISYSRTAVKWPIFHRSNILSLELTSIHEFQQHSVYLHLKSIQEFVWNSWFYLFFFHTSCKCFYFMNSDGTIFSQCFCCPLLSTTGYWQDFNVLLISNVPMSQTKKVFSMCFICEWVSYIWRKNKQFNCGFLIHFRIKFDKTFLIKHLYQIWTTHS